VSNAVSIYIIFLVVGSIIFYTALFLGMRTTPHHDDGKTDINDMTSFDGITETNHPLPGWWLWMMGISIVFGIGYLALYPGLGKIKGALGWVSYDDHNANTVKENKMYDPIYNAFAKESIDDLSVNFKSLKIGKSLFMNNCALCHGLDAKGGNGFPNLTNNKWLYGGTPKEIKTSITNGRRGKMPGYSPVIKDDADVESTALYVLSLSGKNEQSSLTDKGKIKFNTICSACHGMNAKGNKFLGAPDLTDPQWIYGSSLNNIKDTIKNGRNGVMPAHKGILTKEQIHILTAYIYSLNKS